MLLAGESRPNKKSRPSRLFSIHMGKVRSLIKSKTQYLKFSLRNRVCHLHKLVLFTENEQKTNEQTNKQNKTRLYVKYTD